MIIKVPETSDKQMQEIIWRCLCSGRGFSIETLAFKNRDGSFAYQATSVGDACKWAMHQ